MQKTLRSNSSSSFIQILFSNLLTKEEGIHPCLVAQKPKVLLLSTQRALQREKAVSQPALRHTPSKASPSVAITRHILLPTTSCPAQQLLLGTSQAAYQLLRHSSLPLWLLGRARAPFTLARLGSPCHAAVSQPQPCIPGWPHSDMVALLRCTKPPSRHC